MYFCGLIRIDISDRKNKYNEEVTVDDGSRDTVGVKGQESLAGRVYYCGNIMMKEMGDLKKDAKQLEKEAESKEEK